MEEFFTLRCNETVIDIVEGQQDEPTLGSSDDWLWLVGIGCSVLSSIFTAIGTNLQKKAHNIQLALPDDKKAPEIIGLVLNKTWLGALMIMVFLPLPFDFVSFALAPQSVIVPMTGLTIILNQTFAPLILGEKLTRIEVIATMIILAGVACTTVTAGGNPEDYSVCELVRRYLDPDVFIFAFCILGVIGVCLFWIHTYRHPPWMERLRPEMYAFCAGGMGAIMNTIFKATGTLAKGAVDGVEGNTWATIHPYYHIAGVAVLGIFMISYINRGLQQYDSVTFTPLFFCNLIVCSSTMGLIFYKEYQGFSVWQMVLFPTGIVIVCIGILVMTFKGVDLDKVRARVAKLKASEENRRSMHALSLRSRSSTRKSAPIRAGAIVGLAKVGATHDENDDDDDMIDYERGPDGDGEKKIPQL